MTEPFSFTAYYKQRAAEFAASGREDAYERECAAALAVAGFTPGARVHVGPPYLGSDSHGSPTFGHDDVTGLTGRIVRSSCDGADLLLVLDDGREIYAPAPRCKP